MNKLISFLNKYRLKSDFMLSEKYRPKALRDIVGQDSVIKKVADWLKKPGKKALLLYGPTGSGKTVIADALANDLNYDLIELNASDLRNKEQIENALSSAVKQKSLFKKGKIILFDEIDGISSGDRGGASAIIKIIKESAFPVILTANDAYSPKLKEIRQYCTLVQLKKIHPATIEKKLREVCTKEKIKISLDSIKKIAGNAQGDMRAALNDLEVFADAEAGQREKEKNIFEVLRVLFKTMSIEKADEIIRQSDKDLEEIFWWVEQNIPAEYEKPEEIASAFELLSRADLFRARIRKNQNYRFLVYFQEMLAGVALAKQKPYYKFTAYRPPDRLLMLGKSKAERHQLSVVAQDLGKQLHCSTRIIKRDFLPYLKIIHGKDFSISSQ